MDEQNHSTQEENANGSSLTHSSPPEPAPAASVSEPIPKNVPAPRGPKKRTKTGCLTCRKRRIKCGEEKPRCKNCIKSKRECEGYTPRVIFTDPLGGYGPGNIQQMSLRLPLFAQQQRRLSTIPQSLGSQQRLLAPRPPNLPITESSAFALLPTGLGGDTPTPFYYPPVYAPVARPVAPFRSSPPVHGVFPARRSQPLEGTSSFAQSLDQQRVNFQDHAPSTAPRLGSTPALHHEPARPRYLPSSAEMVSPTAVYLDDDDDDDDDDDEMDDYYDVESGEEEDMAEVAQAEGFNQLSLIVASATRDEHQRSFTTFLDEPNILATYRPSMGSSPLNNPKTARIWVHFIHATGPSLSIWERHPTNTSALFSGPVPVAQQGLWTYTMPLKALEFPALLQAILAISSLHIAKLQQATLTISSKHYHYALRRLRKALSLPFRRKQPATLAATLVLAFFEVMAAEHSKWDTHVAGAAQLIKETDFAGLTRDLRAHRRRRMRLQCDPFASLDPWLRFGPLFGGVSEDDPFAEKEAGVNEELVGILMGRVVNYDEFGQVEDEEQRPRVKKSFSRKDIENFRIQTDLYWWYCKQDLFQSMISGNRLYTPFDRWGQCPPRAGIGKLDAIYGSMDHLILLLARLMDFSYQDRKRKLKALELTGGDWRPHPGFFQFMASFGSGDDSVSGPPPGAPPPLGPGFPASTSGEASGSPQLPAENTPMYGMMPSPGSAPLPPAFADTPHSLDTPTSDDDPLDRPTSDAEAQWEQIRAAFDLFARALGADFGPLPADSTPPISTPFGPALQYRTHTIAVFWAFYYTGRILLHRMHPSMPPPAMMAAGVAAPTTAGYARMIGRIAAGIYYPPRFNREAGSLTPTLGATLTEVTVPLFFAGVQYTDPAQRGWTIAKLRDIARLTGWQTAAAIASGCESAWYFAAKKGRGPAYEYTTTDSVAGERRTNHYRSQEADWQQSSNLSHDRRFVKVDKTLRSHWAMGLLELEEDFAHLGVGRSDERGSFHDYVD
ncbi:hypothetical protein Egran_01475 [Elaphomyces granulatus]|uniref:Zn(2)-C6 fungal-type domain-containing protein n=1 Tax=Elaphomyces granulatus TaxID=519963 RepID=A0A232M389_9EURO|nr:hypothetical protein Egran_01475 [Elaphomyces granulatus]